MDSRQSISGIRCEEPEKTSGPPAVSADRSSSEAGGTSPKGGFQPHLEDLWAVTAGRALLYHGGVPLFPDVLVYRCGVYSMAAYVRTLVPWLAEQPPEPTGS